MAQEADILSPSWHLPRLPLPAGLAGGDGSGICQLGDKNSAFWALIGFSW